MSAIPMVTFERSGVVVHWDMACGDLLHFAEANGVEINAGCRYGDCGACLTSIVSGEVEYLHEIGADPHENTCLPCSCKPSTDLILDC
jgi:ferredoxin